MGEVARRAGGGGAASLPTPDASRVSTLLTKGGRIDPPRRFRLKPSCFRGKPMANAVYAALPTTIFSVMSGLARQTGAINLGQGFPDEPGPEAIRRAAAEAVLHGDNQYPPMPGLPELREAVARHYACFQSPNLD